jgi:hypothetical protein
VLPVLLLGHVLAEFALRCEQSAIYNLESFIVLGFGQRILLQIILE